ncbi:hypothetical protein ACSS6W_010042 [Trichoderma asperelloides]|uniref:Infection structure specific protein n=1 Tax=Trichoderma asperellum TaxID=101201 RepID=A0A6V8R018_TRIAP|nr:hypothetical protein LI328DRAFT_133486 [Trichoderma asperelloides]GFP57612.1 hypothetical protein TASIC1_0008045300 [Trichoderma asperellum]
MRSTIAILSLVASASAALDVRALLPRATSTSSDDAGKCASEALSIVSSLPTPPPAIVSDLTEHPQTDPCKISIASSLSADYSSYEAKVLSWFSSHKDELTSLASDCSALASYTSLVPVCSNSLFSAAGATGAAATTGGAATTGAAHTGSSSSKATGAPKSGTSTAGGARETGMGLAVLAAAGLVAVL